MNFAQKKVLSVAAGLASIVFTIVSFCTATVAWFSVNEQVSATGMNIRCADVSSPINLTYDVLKFDDDTKLGVSYGQTPAAIELPEYDSYISKKNEYANVISVRNIDGKRYSNGPAEGLNNSIKTIIKDACGYQNFERFRKRVLLILRDKKDPSH